jgi:hypothetical protein
MMHVKINPEPVVAALTKIYTDGFLLGLDASTDAINQAEKTSDKAALTKADEYTDWANWKPGNRAAALLYRPTGAFKELLDNAGIVSKAIAKVGYDRIGTALSDSIAAGFSPGRAAKVIAAKIGDPARALTIAITEQNRAMSMATIQNYQKYEVEKMEWSGAMPCDICAPNEGQVVEVGQRFNSGDTQPPAHPNCRCALLPVLDDSFYEEPTGGMTLMPMEGAAIPEITSAQAFDADNLDSESMFQVMKGLELTPAQERALNQYSQSEYMDINFELREGIKSNKYIKPIDEIIKKAPPLKQDTMTFRGVSNGPEGDYAIELMNMPVGTVFSDAGYTSTSFSTEVANRFMAGWKDAVLLEIKNPAGTKGISMEALVDNPDSTGEYEWLLPRGTKFKITGKSGNKIQVEIVNG